jgi:hypothetical protein
LESEKKFPFGAWIACRAAASSKVEEAIVGISAIDESRPIEFFVDRSLVDPTSLSQETTIDAKVQVTVLYSDNGTMVINVPGEPITFGPRLTVSSDLLC